MSADEPPKELNVGDYVAAVLDWVEKQVCDEDLFPTDADVNFKFNFKTRHSPKMFQRMFRVFAIIMINPALSGIGERETEETKQLERLFKRFIYFGVYWEQFRMEELDCITYFTHPVLDSYERAKAKYLENRY